MKLKKNIKQTDSISIGDTKKIKFSLVSLYSNPFGNIIFQIIIITAWIINSAFRIQVVGFLLSFIICFFILGQSIRIGVFPVLGMYINRKNLSELIFIDFFISIVSTFCLTMVLMILNLINNVIIPWLFILLIIIFDVIWLFGHGEKVIQYNLDSSIDRKSIASCFLIAIMSISFVIYRLSFFPGSLIPGTDTFGHLAIINQILKDGGSLNIISESSYVYHGIVAILCLFAQVDSIWYMKYSPLVIFPISLILIFIFLQLISNNRIISLLSVTVLMSIYEKGTLLATYRPYTITFAFTFLMTVYIACHIVQPCKMSLPILSFSYILVLILYPYTLFASLPVFIYLLKKEGHLPKSLNMVPSILFQTILFGGIGLSIFYYIFLPTIGIIQPTLWIWYGKIRITDTLGLSFSRFTSAYNIWQIGLIGIGLVFTFMKSISYIQISHDWLNSFDFQLVYYVTSSYFVVFFTPLSTAYRTELFIRHFNTICITIGALVIIILVGKMLTFIKGIKDYSNKIHKQQKNEIIAVFLCLILGFASYWSFLKVNNYFSEIEPRYIEDDEQVVFAWLKKHTNENDYILTDITTGHLIRGLILRNASTSFIINRIVVPPWPLRYHDLTSLIFEFFNSSSDNVLVSYYNILNNLMLNNMANNISFIVLSNRTSAWIRLMREGKNDLVLSASYWRTLTPNDPAWMKFFNSYFKVIFSSGNVYVLSVS